MNRICELEKENESLKKALIDRTSLPNNPRYLLWMMYIGLTEVPEVQAGYINWMSEKIAKHKKMVEYQKEKGITEFKYKNFDTWLMGEVRDYLLAQKLPDCAEPL